MMMGNLLWTKNNLCIKLMDLSSPRLPPARHPLCYRHSCHSPPLTSLPFYTSSSYISLFVVFDCIVVPFALALASHSQHFVLSKLRIPDSIPYSQKHKSASIPSIKSNKQHYSCCQKDYLGCISFRFSLLHILESRKIDPSLSTSSYLLLFCSVVGQSN